MEIPQDNPFNGNEDFCSLLPNHIVLPEKDIQVKTA